jgi:hypothetical protein
MEKSIIVNYYTYALTKAISSVENFPEWLTSNLVNAIESIVHIVPHL